MPGTNLTRDEAAARATLLDVTSYTVDLDLMSAIHPDQTTFRSTTTLEFTCREPGAGTFADLVAPTVREITLNGRSLDPATAYADNRIALDGLEATNTLVVPANLTDIASMIAVATRVFGETRQDGSPSPAAPSIPERR